MRSEPGKGPRHLTLSAGRALILKAAEGSEREIINQLVSGLEARP
jgi:hypothetical protein